MGQQTSSLARKVSKSVSSLFGATSENTGATIYPSTLAVTPFVFKRQGGHNTQKCKYDGPIQCYQCGFVGHKARHCRNRSMYFDEDGDLAHAFYIEEKCDGHARMVQTWRNLYPQGEVDLPHPRLNVDFPIIMCEAPKS